MIALARDLPEPVADHTRLYAHRASPRLGEPRPPSSKLLCGAQPHARWRVLFRDPLGGDWIAGRESLFHGLVHQLLLALIQVFARSPITRGAVGGSIWIGLSRVARLLPTRKVALAA